VWSPILVQANATVVRQLRPVFAVWILIKHPNLQGPVDYVPHQAAITTPVCTSL
jgi:hypothetical protein